MDSNSNAKNNYFLGGSVIVAGLVIALAVIYSVGKPNSNGGSTGGSGNKSGDFLALTPDDIVLGDKKAPVTLLEYADYQCPYCGRFFSETEKPVVDAYVKTGKVRFVYRDLAFLGPESIAASEAAHCANDQAKFWEYHDALYNVEIKDGKENSGNLNRDLFVKLAGDLGMNAAQFSSCLDSKKYEGLIKDTAKKAQENEVVSTPTLFVDSIKILGAQPFNVLRGAIEGELGSKK